MVDVLSKQNKVSYNFSNRKKNITFIPAKKEDWFNEKDW